MHDAQHKSPMLKMLSQQKDKNRKAKKHKPYTLISSKQW